MTSIHIVGALTAADVQQRTVTGLVLPYGSPGHTSVGTVTASETSVEVAPEVFFVIDHRDQPLRVGKMLSSEQTNEGLAMTFSVSKTTAGNDLLTEVADGLRTGLSVEVQNPVIRDGQLMGGLLDAVAAVPNPAFDLARVSAMTAADMGEVAAADPATDPMAQMQSDIDDLDQRVTSIEEAIQTDTTSEDTNQQPVAASLQKDEEMNVATTTPLAASAAPVAADNSIKTSDEFVARLVAARDSGDRQLLAALAEVASTGITGDISQAQFLGELWSRKQYERRYVPLLKSGSLKSYNVQGWRWTDRPVVDDYAGDNAAIASGAVGTEPVIVGAERIAAGWSFDRKFSDFGDTAFLSSFLDSATDDYARKTDAKALAFIKASARAVSPGTVPTGVSAAAAGIVDAALSVIPFAAPEWAILSVDQYREMLLTRNEDVTAYLSMALGLDAGQVSNFKVVPAPGLSAKTIIVGTSSAAQWFELPGSPVRVDALAISTGAFDQGLFGYYAELLHSANGIASVTVV